MLLDTFVEGNGNLAENKGECRVSDLQHQCAPPEFTHLQEGYRPHLALTCWNARSFWALIATLSSPMVLYFAIRIGKALLGSSPKIQHKSKISLDIVLVELELEVIGVRILAFGKFQNLIHRPCKDSETIHLTFPHY
jgi:hypothetical protein